MGITIQAETVDDAKAKLGRNGYHYPIQIRWRKGEPYDYRDRMLPGCIVNAIGMPGQEVERSFKSSAEALRYIASLLKLVDEKVKEQKDEEAKRERDAKHRARLEKALQTKSR